jgi:hypothetical protein
MKRVCKRSSGASYHKQKKERNESNHKQFGAMTKWLEKKSDIKSAPSAGSASNSSSSEDLDVDDIDLAVSACYSADIARDNSSSSDCELDATKAEIDGNADDCELSNHSDYTDDEVSDVNESSVQSVSDALDVLDDTDTANIPTISDSVRIELVRRGSGPLQHRCGPFSSINGRSLTEGRFSRRLTNPQLVPRSWLLYSFSKEAAFCFCCVLFGHRNMKDSSFANVNKGFKNWQKLNPRIPKHEASVMHRQSRVP